MIIIFRVDGANLPEIGTGHIVRSIVLVKHLISKNMYSENDFLFITRSDDEYQYGYRKLVGAGLRVIPYSSGLESNTEEELLILLNNKPDMVVFDRLNTDAKLVKELKKQQIIVVSFDDLGDGHEHTDLTINAILHDITEAKNKLVGYKYLILSHSQAGSFIKSRMCPKKPKSVFISFGGYDHHGLIFKFIRVLKTININIVFNIVIGSSDRNYVFKVRKAIYRLGEKKKRNIALFVDPPKYGEIILGSEFGVVSGGLTAFEAVSRGVPIIGLPQYEHQEYTLKKFESEGLCLFVGKIGIINAVQITTIMKTLIRAPYKLKKVRKKTLEVSDPPAIDVISKKFLELTG